MTTYRVSKRGSIQRDGRNVHRDASERLHRNNAEAGFTLLELLVVLIILGLIAAVVAGPQVFKLLGTAKSEAAGVQIERIGGALDLFRLEVGRYPTQEENLGALVESPRTRQLERSISQKIRVSLGPLGTTVCVSHPRRTLRIRLV